MSDAILVSLGKLYLRSRLRKSSQVQHVLRQKYNGQFRNAGIVLLFDLLMALAVVALVAFVSAVLYVVIS